MGKAKKKKVDIYRDLRRAVNDALAYERGEPIDLRTAEIPAPPKPMKPKEIRVIRENLHASQVVFACFLNVSPKAVQAWEQGRRRPHSTALRLLEIAKKNPGVLLARV